MMNDQLTDMPPVPLLVLNHCVHLTFLLNAGSKIIVPLFQPPSSTAKYPHCSQTKNIRQSEGATKTSQESRLYVNDAVGLLA